MFGVVRIVFAVCLQFLSLIAVCCSLLLVVVYCRLLFVVLS